MSTEVNQANAVCEENTEKEVESIKKAGDSEQVPAEETPIANGNAEATESQDAPKIQENGVDESEPESAPKEPEVSSEPKPEVVETNTEESPATTEEVKETTAEETKTEDKGETEEETNEPAPAEKPATDNTEAPSEPEPAKETATEPEPAKEAATEESKAPEESSAAAESQKTEEVKDGEEKEEKAEDATPIAAAANAESAKTDEGAAVEGEAAGKRNFAGKYRQVESENTEAFFQAIGMPWLLRKMVTKINPSTEIKQDGEKFQIKMVTGVATKESKFTVGEDFEDSGFGWRKEATKVSPAWDEDKLVLSNTPKNEKSKSKPMKVSREMDGDRMTMLLEVGDVVCKRVFERRK